MQAARNVGMTLSAVVALTAAPLSASAAEESRPMLSSRMAPAHHIGVGDTVGSLLDDPAFAGFASLLLPWDGRRYDRDMRLTDIASLMPYHSHVDPKDAVVALNRMVDDANAGRPIIYDVYTEDQKRADPTKAKTGLFFFRGKPGAPFAIISPGGGFAYVGSLHEGFPYALEINAAGLNAFVLRYRPGAGERAATEDLAAAISYVFGHSETLGVGTAGYSLWGSSAGARMAANIGSHGTLAYGGDAVPGPVCVVMAYTAHADRARQEPPTFAMVGERDGIAPPSVMERRIAALRAAGTPAEYHVYPGLGHGFGLGKGTAAEGWVADAIRFWRANAGPGSHEEGNL